MKAMSLKIFKRQRLYRKNFKVEYFSEFEAIFKNILGDYSGAPGWLNHEQNRRSKISWHCPFKETISYQFVLSNCTMKKGVFMCKNITMVFVDYCYSSLLKHVLFYRINTLRFNALQEENKAIERFDTSKIKNLSLLQYFENSFLLLFKTIHRREQSFLVITKNYLGSL